MSPPMSRKQLERQKPMTMHQEESAICNLSRGSHHTFEEGHCLLEVVAHLAGEPHTDHPACACPVISAAGRRLNDAILSDERRNVLLGGLAPMIVGTKDASQERARSLEWLDWIIRVSLPAWLELSPDLRSHAAKLREMPMVSNQNMADFEQPVRAAGAAARDAMMAAAGDAVRAAARGAAMDAVRAAARDAARDAAMDASRNAAGDAVRDVAWDAAGDAACDAAMDAAYDAVRDAAWCAARNAARAAAWTAAWTVVWTPAWAAAWAATGDVAWTPALDASIEALQATKLELQESAVELLHRQCSAAAAGREN